MIPMNDSTTEPQRAPFETEPPDVQYTVRLPQGLHEALRIRAKAEDRRLAQTVRAALRDYLSR